jgi:hypothetical protein
MSPGSKPAPCRADTLTMALIPTLSFADDCVHPMQDLMMCGDFSHAVMEYVLFYCCFVTVFGTTNRPSIHVHVPQIDHRRCLLFLILLLSGSTNRGLYKQGIRHSFDQSSALLSLLCHLV